MRSIFKKITNGRNAVITAGVIYTVMAVITVASAWIIDLHRFDLWLSISRYVALRPWTAVLYFFCAVAMAVIVIRYPRHTPMPRYRKVIYLLIIICVCGCAVFPCNREWSRTVAGISLFKTRILSDKYCHFSSEKYIYARGLLVLFGTPKMPMRPVFTRVPEVGEHR